MYVRMHIYVCMCVRTHMYIYVCMCMYACMYVCPTSVGVNRAPSHGDQQLQLCSRLYPVLFETELILELNSSVDKVLLVHWDTWGAGEGTQGNEELDKPSLVPRPSSSVFRG